MCFALGRHAGLWLSQGCMSETEVVFKIHEHRNICMTFIKTLKHIMQNESTESTLEQRKRQEGHKKANKKTGWSMTIN